MTISESSASTSSLPDLAITGVTGRVGGMVARELAADGIPLRLLARRPEAAPELPGATVVAAEYADDARTRSALDGVRTLFLVSAAERADRLEQHRAVIDAAAAAGVEHVVYTSFLGASDDATFTLARDHASTEQHLRASGMAHTFLRDDFYLDFFAHLPGDDGAIRGPAGSGRVAAVAQADVARTAAAILRDPAAHAGATYDLTGPEALTLDEVARILTESTGRAITFHDETLDEAYASRASYGAPDWQVDAWVSTYTAIAAGELDGVTDAVERVTGRRPLSLRELLAG